MLTHIKLLWLLQACKLKTVANIDPDNQHTILAFFFFKQSWLFSMSCVTKTSEQW